MRGLAFDTSRLIEQVTGVPRVIEGESSQTRLLTYELLPMPLVWSGSPSWVAPVEVRTRSPARPFSVIGWIEWPANPASPLLA